MILVRFHLKPALAVKEDTALSKHPEGTAAVQVDGRAVCKLHVALNAVLYAVAYFCHEVLLHFWPDEQGQAECQERDQNKCRCSRDIPFLVIRGDVAAPEGVRHALEYLTILFTCIHNTDLDSVYNTRKKPFTLNQF